MNEPTKALALPDTKDIDQKALSVLEASKGLVIQNDKHYVSAGDFLKSLRDIQSEIRETFDPAIHAAHEAHKAVLAAKAKHAKPIEEAERIVKDKMLGYQDDRERQRRAEEARLREAARQQEEEDRNARAQQLIEAGKPEEALAILDQEVEPPPVILRAGVPKIKGVIQREGIKAEVYDLMALVKGVASGAVPIALIEPNMKAINAMMRAADGKLKLPGVQVVPDKTLVTRGE